MERETSWTLIRAAADGQDAARNEFAERYAYVVRQWLGARWRGHALAESIDDAVQEVFLQCFAEHGALERAAPGRGDGFRAFLYGIIRHVAQKHERSLAREHKNRDPRSIDSQEIENDETALSRVFDRAWARTLIKEAWKLNSERASEQGDAHLRRVELLRLRFEENLPIRDIAERWGMDPVKLHRDYARARREFKAVLRQVVGLHETHGDERLAERCDEVLLLLR